MWEYFMFLVHVENILELIIMYGSKDIINVGILTNNDSFRQSKMTFLIFHLVDILFNLVSQHEINATDKTIFLIDTLKFYLKKNFWLDVLSLLNFMFLIFYPEKDYLLTEIIFKAMTKAHEIDELEEKFIARSFPERKSLYFIGISQFFFFQLSKPLYLIRFINYNRILRQFRIRREYMQHLD